MLIQVYEPDTTMMPAWMIRKQDEVLELIAQLNEDMAFDAQAEAICAEHDAMSADMDSAPYPTWCYGEVRING